ncbi:MAG: hypothetical protein MPEBLZ_02243 [Candidatus Methanoperedens nitroreducens]|uniref:Uncharacterized protein n=2 Tax=Candidatus Methanoperedens TaxID=1392997 RepID=A0A0P8A4W5_9EURY|nr:MAG: hypothetical protein MPEBLZ_02243 [Candidatus Methanoperedens sp. BLZ1]MCX9087188.1 hypothetical protein [Candidatus Methanoperedens sp.]CAG0981647.1 hypothetical protein METP2_02016 [Methanosarcinales archaeon]
MKKIVSINPATGEVNEEFELYSEDRVLEKVFLEAGFPEGIYQTLLNFAFLMR